MALRNVSQIRQFLSSLHSGIGKSSVIYPSTFLVSTGISIIELGIIFYIKDIFGATPSQVGYFTALWFFCYIIGCVFIRPIFKKVLPRYLLIGSTFFMFLFILLVLNTKTFIYAYMYFSLYGMAMSFFWPPIMGWLSQDIEGSQLGKSMSYFSLSWNVGLIIGPFLAGILSAISPEVPLWAGGLLCLLAAILITIASITLPKIRSDKSLDTAQSGETPKTDTSTLFRFPGWVGMFSTFVVIGVIVNIFPVFARDELLLKKEIIGILMQSRTFIGTFVFVILGHTTFWHFRVSQMIVGQICLACAIFFMMFISSPLLLVLFISLLGALRAISYSNSFFHGVSGSINRTRRMAIHEALLASGIICGSLLGGLLYQHFSMTVVYTLCAAVVMFGVVIQTSLFFLLRTKQAVK
ncbi:MAG: MFS transporter [Spirochaetota bacterium]|nr:MAG: MFS transporter [Spirochaetota bacterium]